MVEGSVLAVGVTPATGRILEIQGRRRELETTPTLFATSALSRDLGLEDAGDGVAGALCVSVLNKPAITMMWFRRERQFEIRWGGDPAHAHIADDAGRLSPRKSFAQFLQNIRGQSTSWTQEELESAAELGSLIEIEALREREAFAQTILDSIPEHLAVLDARGVIVKVNRAWCRFAEANGASPAAASGVGLSYLDICMAGAGSPDGAEAWSARAGIEAVIGKSSDFFTLDYPCDSPTERRWFRMSVFPMIAPCDGVVVFHENVTQRKLAELALQSSQARVRSIFEAMTEGLVLHGRDGRILDANPAAEAILGRNRDEILGHASSDDSWQAFRGDGSPFPGREHPAMLALATGKSQLDVVMQVQPMNGARRWVQVNAVPTVVDGIVEGVVASFVDVTQLRAAIDRVTELNRTLEERVAQRTEQLRRLGGDLAAVEERERRQIARDLHDDIAQTLAAASIRLAGLQSMDDPEVRSIAGTVDGLIRAADQATRSLAAHLAPPALVEIGLVAALGVLCRELAEVYGLAVAVEDDGAPKPLSQEARAILYRAVRELLINVVKHARAGRAGVTCRRAGNDIVLKVADSGVGFDTGAVAARSAPGLGLPGIRERIMYIGGELELRTSPGAGTEAAITAPLMQASAPALQANA
jgi:PAS domain S-box-containing protein